MKFFAGKYTGHSAAAYICCGFQPAFVLSINMTDPAWCAWIATMTDATGLQNDDNALAAMTAGFTPYAGGDVISSASDEYQDGLATQIAAGITAPAGFMIGTDEDLNTDGETFYFIAIGNDPPTAEVPYRLDGSTVVHTNEDEN